MTVREFIVFLGFKYDETPAKKQEKQIDSLKDKSNKLATATKGIGVAWKIASAVAVIGMGWISKNILDQTAEMEQYRNQLQKFTGDADSAAAILAKLRDTTADPLFGTGNLVHSYKQLRNLGMEADSASNFINVLGDIADGSTDNFNALTTALTRVSVSGKVNDGTIRQLTNAGFGLQDMAEALGKSTAQLSAEIEAGRIGFNDITLAMSNATKEGGRFYQNMERQARTLTGSIKILKDTLEDIGEGIGTRVLPKIVDTIRYISDLIELGKEGFINFGARAFEVLIGAIQDIIIFFQILQMRMRKFGGAFTPLKALFEDVFGFLKSVIESAYPFLLNLATLILVAFKPIQAFVKPILEALKPIIKDVFAYAARIIGAIIPIVNGLTPVFKFLGNIIGSVVSIMANGAFTIIKALSPFIGLILTIIGIIKIWTTVQWLLNVAMSANPIGLIIIAIVALIGIIVLLVKNWDKVVAAMKKAFGAISNFFIKIWDGIKSFFSKVVDFVKKNALNIMNVLLAVLFFPAGVVMAVVRLIIKHWDKIKPALLKIFTAVANFFSSIWNGIKKVALAVWDGIKNAATSVVDGVKTGWQGMTGFFSGLWDGIKNITASIWDGIKNIFFGVVNSIKTIWSGITGFFSGLWEALKQSPSEALDYIKNAFFGLFDNIKNKFLGFINVIKEGWEKVKSFFGAAKDGIVNFITGGGNEEAQTKPVNDLIVTPEGKYSTHPDDYIMAMKNPGDLLEALMRFLGGGQQMQPAYAGGAGSLVGDSLSRATANHTNYNNSNASNISNITAPISVNVNASGMSPEAASAAVKRGVQDALKDAIHSSRGAIPSPEARRG
jgi:tape measure domain-containing protein